MKRMLSFGGDYCVDWPNNNTCSSSTVNPMY